MISRDRSELFRIIVFVSFVFFTASFSYSGDSDLFKVSSPAIQHQGELPIEYTCDGGSSSPPVEWTGVPKGTKSFALSLWHDARLIKNKSYWVIYNIQADVRGIPKNAKRIGVDGYNEKGLTGYDPMCSSAGGVRIYNITVFALSEELKFDTEKVKIADLLPAMEGKILAKDTLTYTFTRSKDQKEKSKSSGKP